MKKNIIIATIAVASAFILSVSCQKQEISVSENTNDSEIVAFSATIDQESTKTVLVAGSANNKFKVNWESTDKISIKGAEYTASIIQTDATKATFSGYGATKEDNKYKAIYPSSLYKTDHFELPSIQTYAAGKFNAPMYAESETESLAFKNICGVLCLSLKGTEKVKSISVTANEAICGAFEMTDATAINLTGGGKTVTLDCGTGGVQLNEETATKFYIYLPPNTYTAGMRITIITTDNKYFEKTTKTSVSIERSNLYTFEWTPAFTPIPDGTVDLGLSVFWATDNLGAATSGANGDYYAFGSTELIYSSVSDDWINYINGNFENNIPYYNGGSYTKYTGNDGKTRLEAADDAAYTKLGEGWRTPTKEEYQELINNCNITQESNGYKFTSKVNGISIMFTYAKYFLDNEWPGAGGLYLTSSLYTETISSCWCFRFDDLNSPHLSGYWRAHGCTVRPVHDK